MALNKQPRMASSGHSLSCGSTISRPKPLPEFRLHLFEHGHARCAAFCLSTIPRSSYCSAFSSATEGKPSNPQLWGLISTSSIRLGKSAERPYTRRSFGSQSRNILILLSSPPLPPSGWTIITNPILNMDASENHVSRHLLRQCPKTFFLLPRRIRAREANSH